MSTTSLYDVVTPEKTYLGYNFMHRDYDRDAESAGMIVIDIWLMEILQTATAQFQNTQSPTTAGQQGQGNVTAQTPNQTVEQDFNQLTPPSSAAYESAFSSPSAQTQGSNFVFGGT